MLCLGTAESLLRLCQSSQVASEIPQNSVDMVSSFMEITGGGVGVYSRLWDLFT